MKGITTLLTSALWVLPAQTLSPSEWRGQSIYQVLTDRFARTDGSTNACADNRSYCGGTWRGLIKKLDYIQGMGFTAIWISPVVKNIEGYTAYGDAYHGYWAQDIYSVNPHFGTADDLKALSQELHSRGMYLMVDVVTNHMGYAGSGSSVNYGIYNPFNSASFYHPYCAIDWNSAVSVEQCWQGDSRVSLPDMRTEDSGVRSTWNGWIKDLVSTYGIDGLRIDSARNVEKTFFPNFESAAGVGVLGEVFNGDPAVYPDLIKYLSGLMNYAAYFWVQRFFTNTGNTTNELLTGINTMKGQMRTANLGSFSENHDNPRLASLTGDTALIKNAIAMTTLMDGIPTIYQGQEQKFSGAVDPNNREALWTSGYNTNHEIYRWIASLNALRNQAVFSDGNTYLDYQAIPTSPDSHTIALRKASIVSVYSNSGSSGGERRVNLVGSFTGYSANTQLTEVLSCTTLTTDGSGGISTTIGAQAKAFYPTSKLSGSGICNVMTPPPTNPPPSGCSAVPVTFNGIVTTQVGQTIKIVGSTPELGSWDPTRAIVLDASRYTASNHLWLVTLNLPPGTAVQYKYINVASTGVVTWEKDPNRSFTTSVTCGTTSVRNDAWQT